MTETFSLSGRTLTQSARTVFKMYCYIITLIQCAVIHISDTHHKLQFCLVLKEDGGALSTRSVIQ